MTTRNKATIGERIYDVGEEAQAWELIRSVRDWRKVMPAPAERNAQTLTETLEKIDRVGQATRLIESIEATPQCPDCGRHIPEGVPHTRPRGAR